MPYVYAALSAVAMAGVILMDALMRTNPDDPEEGIYNRWSQPLIISCALNPLFALPIWLYCLPTWSQPSTQAMLMAVLAGVVLAVANALYFMCMYSPAGESAEIAAFDSAGPAGIALLTGLLTLTGVRFEETIGMDRWAGILLASLALAMIHLWNPRAQHTDRKHLMILLSFGILNAVHMMLIDTAQKHAAHSLAAQGVPDAEFAGMMATFPYYWLGLLSGLLPLLMPREFAEFWGRRKIFLKRTAVIVLVEILAMFAFAMQLAAFSGGHVAVMAMIGSTFNIMVFGGGLLARKLDIPGAKKKFAEFRYPVRRGIAVALLILGVGLGAGLVEWLLTWW